MRGGFGFKESRCRDGNAYNSDMPDALLPSGRTISSERLQGDLIQPGHPLFGIIWVNPRRISGAPCFTGTRVPIKNLFDFVKGGDPLDEFLDGFPGVTREQAVAVLELAEAGLLEKLGVK
jgi:uncharacterized protein (DUF433 family)